MRFAVGNLFSLKPSQNMKPQRIGSHGLILALILAFCASGALAQHPWDTVLSPSRATDWTVVGLPTTITYGTGGSACNGTSANCVETILNAWTPPTRVQIASTIACANTSADPTTINATMAAALPGSKIVYSGVCDINADIIMVNGVDLEAANPSSGSLNVTGSTTQFTFDSCCGGINSGTLSATSYAAGTTTATVTGATCGASCSELVAGNIAYFEQCDDGWSGTGTSFSTDPSCTSGAYVDTLGVWVCGIDFPACSTNSSGTGGHFYLRQTVFILTVVNNGGGSYTITYRPGFDTPLWSSNRNAQLFWTPRNTHTFGAGIRNSTVNFSFNTNEKFTNGGYAWFIYGNRVIGFPNTEFIAGAGANGLIGFNYIFGNNSNNLATNVSEPIVRALGGSTLTISNMSESANCVWANGQSNTSANAYNACRDSATGFATSIILTHNPFESCRLDEGNSLSNLQYDDTHGTGDFCDTALRNHINMNDPPYITYVSTNPRGPQVDNFHRVINLLGNVIESHGPNPNGITAYQGPSSSVGNAFVIPTSDQLATASLLRLGNYDTITGATRNCFPGAPGFTSAPCNGSSASSLTASESSNTVTVVSTLNPGTANPTIVTMTGCSPSGYNGMFQVTVSSGSSFQYTDYANSGLGAATGCTATLGNEVPTILAGNLSPFSNITPSTTIPFSMFLGVNAAHPSGGTGLSWWKACVGYSTFPTCNATSTPPWPAIGGNDVSGGPFANGHAYSIPAELILASLPIDTGTCGGASCQQTFSITGTCAGGAASSWSAGIETLCVSLAAIDNGSNEHIMGGFQLSGVNSACIPASGASFTNRPDNEIRMTGSSTTTIQYALPSNPSVSCAGSLLFPDIKKFDVSAFQADSGATSPIGTQLNGKIQLGGKIQIQ